MNYTKQNSGDMTLEEIQKEVEANDLADIRNADKKSNEYNNLK
jgi:hypothetical protein